MSEANTLAAAYEGPPFDFDFPALIEEVLKNNGLRTTPEQTFKITRAVIAAQKLLLGAVVDHRHSQELCALTAQLVKFCAMPVADDPVLRDACFHCLPEPGPERMAQPHAPEDWNYAEHHAGYRAFFDYRTFDFDASFSWQMGWQSASLELEYEPLDLKALNELPPPAMYGAFGPGDLARDLGLPFDEYMDSAWQAAWVRRDTELGYLHDSAHA